MITTTRRWLRRNGGRLMAGATIVSAGYLAVQYVWSTLSEANERRRRDGVAQENLRRRFQQNQEDCSLTVLALLPTAADNIVRALPVEDITLELQRKKTERLARGGGGAGSLDVPAPATSEPSSGPSSVVVASSAGPQDDGASLRSGHSEGYVHASRVSTEGGGGDGSGSVSDLGPSGRGTSGTSTTAPSNKTKAQLWMELKIGSIVRTFTLVYTLALLTLLTRLQLNLLGRRNYVASVLEDREADPLPLRHAAGAGAGADFDTNRCYLTFTWWLLHRGWRGVMDRVERAVRDVFGPVNPREEISAARLAELVLEVRRAVEGGTAVERRSKKWLPHLLPSPEHESLVLRESGMSPEPSSSASSDVDDVPASRSPIDGPLRMLLDETADLIDSPHFNRVLTRLLDAGFSLLIDDRVHEQAFVQPPPPSSSQQRHDAAPTDDDKDASPSPKTRLANVLAVMTRQAHAVGHSGDVGAGVGANAYLRVMDRCGELDAFAAVVFCENLVDREAVGLEGRGGESGKGMEGVGNVEDVDDVDGHGNGNYDGNQDAQEGLERVWDEASRESASFV